MWTPEKKLKARGVKFYFITKQAIQEKDYPVWQDSVARSSPLSKYFRRVEFNYFPGLGTTLLGEWRGWNLAKIVCTDVQDSVKPSEARKLYNNMFLQ